MYTVVSGGGPDSNQPQDQNRQFEGTFGLENLPGASQNTGTNVFRRIDNPRDLLCDTPDVGHATELVHAATLFSDGAVTASGEIHPTVRRYIREASAAGIDTLYVVGVYKTSRFSRLVMPHFAKEWSKKPPEHHIGPSVFSIAEMTPNKNIGSWDNLAVVTRAARAEGVTLVLDFVPNTIALDSLVAREHPEFLRGYDRPAHDLKAVKDYYNYCVRQNAKVFSNRLEETHDGIAITHTLDVYSVDGSEELMVHTREQPGETHRIYLIRNLRTGFQPYTWIEHSGADGYQAHCKQLGTDGYTNWADVAMLETNSPQVQRWQAEFLKRVQQVTPIVRADMSHLPHRDYWLTLAEEVKQIGGTMPQIWGEAYGPGVHDELAQRNVHTYANFIREWLTAPEVNVADLMRQLFSDPVAREFYKRGMSVAYTANHDDEMGTYMPREGATATILCALPVSKVMFAQGQRHGDTRRYGADQHVPMQDFQEAVEAARRNDPGYAAHMDRLTPLIDRDVFRSPASDWRPAYIQSLNQRELHKIFHIVRSLGDERVLTVVDCEPSAPGAEITINLSVSFDVPADELGDYVLVDMFSGAIQPAEKMLSLLPDPNGPGFSSYMYGLVKKERIAPKLAA